MATLAYTSPFGPLGLEASPRGVVRLSLLGPVAAPDDGDPAARAILADAARQLDEYFAGRRTCFDVPLDADLGAGFRARALRALADDVPFGSTVTYGELAGMAGSPRAARAAGSACATNPVPLFIPCHRVLPSSGGTGAYGGGAGMKRLLLELEGVTVSA